MHRRLNVLLILFILVGLCPALIPTGAMGVAVAASLQTDGSVPPLSRSCIRGVTPGDYRQTVCCVSGYVYQNGVPVAGAQVQITVNGRTLDTLTQSGPDSALPYYAASLDATPLAAQIGDSVSVTASNGGQSKTISFVARADGQQQDIVLPLAQAEAQAFWKRTDMLARTQAAMVYDPVRQRVLLFGGTAGTGVLEPLADTWEWDGTSWTQLFPAASPPARYGHTMVYDTQNKRMLLFGGIGVGGQLAAPDLWAWDGNTWARLTPTGNVPPARQLHAMAYDSDRQMLMLFGGLGSTVLTTAPLRDTWEWNGTAWTQRTPAGSPTARQNHAMTYDVARKKVVLYGGTNLSDFWEWDGNNWTMRTVAAVWPGVQAGHAMTYDSTRQKVVLFGTSNSIWEWDGTVWVKFAPTTKPTWASQGPAFAYDAARQKVVLFGGSGKNETWAWDGASWTRLDAVPVLTARYGHTMAYDPVLQQVLLFGGRDNSAYFNDTWVWNPQTASWSKLSPAQSPPARIYHTMVYDAARQQIVLFGGLSTSTALGDTWVWDGTTWAQRTPATSPSARYNYAMAYDSVRQCVVLVGGTSGSTETWEWDGTTWANRTPANPVPTFSGSSNPMAYDATRQRIVLYTTSAQTWEWDGSSWTQITPASSSKPVAGGAMIYDSARQRIMLFGGTNTNQLWEWDGTNWTPIPSSTIISGRTNHAIAYDSVSQRMVLFGGLYGTGLLGDTWAWDGKLWHQRLTGNPPASTSAAMSYEANGNSLLFGAFPSSCGTYRWDGTSWEHLAPIHTPTCTGTHLARNADGSRLLFFGGTSNATATWLWDGSDWIQPNPPAIIPLRTNYSLTYDSARSVWVLFGGQNNTNVYLNDTWEYNPATNNWSQYGAVAPPARARATLTYDPIRGKSVLVGGQGATGYLNDVWEWDGTNWANVTPTAKIDARAGHGAAYDNVRQMVVIAGGQTPQNTWLNDTWEWDGTRWTQRFTTPAIPALSNLAMDYDPQHGQIVAFQNATYLHQVTTANPAPVATINWLSALDVVQGQDSVSGEGSATDPDVSDIIQAYRWTLNGQLISSTRTFSVTTTSLPVGSDLVLRFEAQDNEENWSPAIERRMTVRIPVNPNQPPPPAPKTWTILIYAVADNDLDPWLGNGANGMLARLKAAGAQANVQVGILYDGPGISGSSYYTLTAEGTWNEQTLPEQQMDKMTTLRNFVAWGLQTFQSDYYALSIVDHANGLVGIGRDDSSKVSPTDPAPFLNPRDVRAALDEATNHGARKLDVVIFDGCSFGLLEDASIVDGLAYYVVASPTAAWGVFAYERYRQIAGATGNEPRAVALGIAEIYATRVLALRRPFTLSVFDMGRFAAANSAASALGQALLTYVSSDPTSRTVRLMKLREGVQKYDSGGVSPVNLDVEDSYVDLVDLAQHLKDELGDAAVSAAANQVIAAVEGAQPFVIAAHHASGRYVDAYINLEHARGLGIYYPPVRMPKLAGAQVAATGDSAIVGYLADQLFPITYGSQWTTFLATSLPQTAMAPGPDNTELLPPPPPTPDLRVFLPMTMR